MRDEGGLWLIGPCEVDARPIRRRGDGGALVEAGVSWLEDWSKVRTALAAPIWAVYIYALFQVGKDNLLLTLGITIAALVIPSALFNAFGWRLYTRWRAVTFRDDGRMAVSRPWFSHGRKLKALTFPHADVRSIEQSGERVVFLMDDGDSVVFADKLFPHEAVKLAVQLNKALQDIREAMSTARRQRAAQHSPKRAFID